MKKVLTFIGALAFLLISTFAFAQAPQKFNYQGIARDAKGNPMSKQTLALKLSVLPTSDATVPEYEETQLVTTNEFGLYTLQIGNGTAITGEMKTVKWETGNKYIKVAIDPTGGTNYVDAGTNQLLSVPYALYADKAGESRTSTSGSNETRSGTVSTSAAGTGTTNYLAKFTGANTIYNSQIFDNGSQIGIGTTSPSTTAKLHISSVTGTQPLILESPVGVHSLIREAGSNRGYFGSYIGSGAPYPTPAGTSNADFDIGTSGSNPTGKLHLATNTTPRVTILPTTGNVGIGTTSPTTKLEVVGQVKITGGTPGAGKVLTSDATGLATWQTPSGGGGAVSSVNGATGAVVNSLTMGSAGTNTAVTGSGTNAVTINIPTASATNTGKLSNTDWTTFNNKLGGTGTANRIPKYTGASTLGNSKLIDQADGLLYNTNAQDNGYGSSMVGITLHNPAASTVLKNSNPFENDLIMTHSTYNIIFMADSTKIASGNYDSVGVFMHGASNNNLFLGGLYNDGLVVRPSTGKIFTGNYYSSPSSDAHLSIISPYDTAAHFSADNDGGNNNIAVLADAVSITDGVSGVLINAIYNGTADPSFTNGQIIDVYSSTQDARGSVISVSNQVGNTSGITEGMNIYSEQNGTSSNYGMSVYAGTNSTTGIGGTIGLDLYAIAPDSNSGQVKGVNAIASGGNGGARGVSGTATGDYVNFISNDAYGIYGQAYGGSGNANYAYSIYGAAASGAFGSGNYAGYFNGNTHINGTLSKAGGTFKIDHPQDPENKYLIHSFVESPDMMNVYNGNITTDANGNASVELPSYFEAENKDFKYQLTVIDNSNDFVMAKVTEEVNNNTFKVKTSKANVKISWQVTGVRQDAWANANRVVPEVEKNEREKGKYLNPEVFGKDKSFSMNPEPAERKPEVDPKLQREQAERKAQLQERLNKKPETKQAPQHPIGGMRMK